MTCEIQLTQDQVALVDDEDCEWANQYKWCSHFDKKRGRYEAVRYIALPDGKRKMLYMHRELLSAKPGEKIAYIDHDALNNCRGNLRFLTPARTGWLVMPRGGGSNYLGVIWHKPMGAWHARIQIGISLLLHLGHFATEEDAARAYDEAARERYGKDARLNFPGPGERSVLDHDDSEGWSAASLA